MIRCWLWWIGLLLTSGCRHLPPFTVSSPVDVHVHRRQKTYFFSQAAAVYPQLRGFFGYVPPGSVADVHLAGQPYFAVYLWLSKDQPELGVRLASPALDETYAPDSARFDPLYLRHRHSQISFSPILRLEKCQTAVEMADLSEPCEAWSHLGETKGEALQQAARAGHATLRVQRATHGLYRLAFTCVGVCEVQGTYVLQAGGFDLAGSQFSLSVAQLAQVLGRIHYKNKAHLR